MAEQLSFHVDKKLGITNVLLQDLVRICAPIRCKGVFSSDIIPPPTCPATYIVNLSPSWESVGHFVAVIILPSHVLYADPFGFPPPPTNTFIQSFLNKARRGGKSKRRGKGVFFSKKRVQATFSPFCGLYSLLFCASHEPRTKCRVPKTYFSTIKPNALYSKTNDRKCIQKLYETLKAK